jgi:hypothetical protein
MNSGNRATSYTSSSLFTSEQSPATQQQG